MLTIVETQVFQRAAREVWTDAELDAFKVWLANDPMAGSVITGSAGFARCAGRVREWAGVAVRE